VGWTVLRVAPAASVTRPDDRNRLRLGLAKMEWVRAIPTRDERSRVIDGIAAALLPAVAHARLGVAPTSAKARKTAGRRRKPGGGRRAAVTLPVLAGDVERALQDSGVPAGRWRVDGRNSRLLAVLALCWEIATGERRRDLRRMTAKPRVWRLQPTGKLHPAER
jgi:hypothetical protein